MLPLFRYESLCCLVIALLSIPANSAVARVSQDQTMNHLRHEKSPYLQQHASNPVDWHPWGDEAFARALREEKLIFLSIGYSTCHWCHVMAHESFEDDEVAGLLNRDYVAIKVDREERPDIDQVYMDICVQWTGSGGWPLTIIMTPDGLPVFAGTFLPKHDRYQRPGMMTLLPLVAGKWREDPQQLRQLGRKIVAQLTASQQPAGRVELGLEIFDAAVETLKGSFDSLHGGFGKPPKFPRPHSLIYLLQRYRKSGDEQLLKMVEVTLRAMRGGGIYDHLGYGFHRYSTDREWLTPHFEKMLYDQAGLAQAYVETYQLTDDDVYASTAREIFDYVLRDMTDEKGGFYSAEDADSEGEEGKFYVWSSAEVESALGKERARVFSAVYDVTPDGNYFEEATGEATGTSILHSEHSLEYWAKQLGLDVPQLAAQLQEDRRTLFGLREQRIPPHKDDKILTAWNGLMISALARGGQVMGEPRYIEAARGAADFVKTYLRDGQGRLLRRYRQGDAAIMAFATDHAFLAAAMLDLYAVTFELDDLLFAIALGDELAQRFQSLETGQLYETASDAESLVFRPKQAYDGAMPAASSVALQVYAKLYLLTGQQNWRQRADQLLQALSAELKRYPAGYTELLQGAALLMQSTREVVIVGMRDDLQTEALLRAASSTHAPETVVLFRPETGAESLLAQAAYAREMTTLNGKPAAYVCENFSCRQPTSDPLALMKQLSVAPGSVFGQAD